VEPELGVVQEVAGGERNPFLFQRMTHMEITFTPIQLGQGVAGAIVLGELQLVRRRDEIATGVVVLL
jgi:hypothetical protein